MSSKTAATSIQTEDKYYKGEKLDEVQNYIANLKINEIVQSLTQGLLVDRPANPRLYMEKQLQLLRSVKVNLMQFILMVIRRVIKIMSYLPGRISWLCFDSMTRSDVDTLL